MTITNIDGALPLARRRLHDAITALAAPQPVATDGGYWWEDPLYVNLRGALRGSRTRRSGVRGPRPPCRVEVLGLLIDIDTTVAGWEPHGKGTLERFQLLAGRAWRPQDCDLLDGYSSTVERWVLAAAEVVTAAPRVFLEMPCPRCSARFAYRDGGGERVRARALRVSEEGCKCLACGSFWPPERFEWLARLLGCPALRTG